MHCPVSPQCSDWVKDDARTPEELENMLREFLTAVCKRYNGVPGIISMDVVNETTHDNEWKKNAEGTGWEVPWYIIGQDSDKNKTPLYIKMAFEIANEHAPDLKLIYNHHEDMNKEGSWRLIKETITSLRAHGLRVDGIGWQAHVNNGWATPENVEKLEALIDWAHSNDLEFHVTEASSWQKDGVTRESLEEQAYTYSKIVETLIAKRSTGVVGWNTWHIDDGTGWHQEWYGAIFDKDLEAKPAYYSIQKALEDGVKLENLEVIEAAGASVSIAVDMASTQQKFGVSRLERSLRHLNLRPVVVNKTAASGAEHITAALIDPGADPAIKAIKKEGSRIVKNGSQVQVQAIDETGLMYGLIEVGDYATSEGVSAVPEKLVNPRFPFRAVKFNLPWHAYRGDNHESKKGNSETMRDLKFWAAFLDMMSENRLNALTLWTKHPFTYMIRAKNFPKATRWNEEELDEWRAFWHALFKMAKDKNIETYLVTWNTYVGQNFDKNYQPGEDGEDNDNALVQRYNKESVTQTINEYPNLTGLGVSLGEDMDSFKNAQARADWVMDVYVDGIRKANRKCRFIHRAPFTNDPSITVDALETITDFDEPIIVEYKFNWSHGHSTPRLVQTHTISDGSGGSYWNPEPNTFKMAWMVRNEDFFVLNWGEPDFVREHIQVNGQSYVGGYFIGSEDYLPAKDLTHEESHPHYGPYAFQKQWLFYKTWGRILYDPSTPDAVFEKEFDRRYGRGLGSTLMEAEKLVSRMPLKFASFIDNSWDWTLHSEGFLAPKYSGDGYSEFVSINEILTKDVLDDDYISIKGFVRNPGTSKITPLQLADGLESDGDRALALVSGIKPEAGSRLECELNDIKTWAHLSKYFALKLRGGVALQKYRSNGGNSNKSDAVTHLEAAAQQWRSVAEITGSHYRTVPVNKQDDLNRRGLKWSNYIEDVERDVNIARND